jgi:hypothetical protein
MLYPKRVFVFSLAGRNRPRIARRITEKIPPRCPQAAAPFFRKRVSDATTISALDSYATTRAEKHRTGIRRSVSAKPCNLNGEAIIELSGYGPAHNCNATDNTILVTDGMPPKSTNWHIVVPVVLTDKVKGFSLRNGSCF